MCRSAVRELVDRKRAPDRDPLHLQELRQRALTSLFCSCSALAAHGSGAADPLELPNRYHVAGDDAEDIALTKKPDAERIAALARADEREVEHWLNQVPLLEEKSPDRRR